MISEFICNLLELNGLWKKVGGSSITIEIIIIIQYQLAKLLSQMQTQSHQRLAEDHTLPSDHSSPHGNTSLVSSSPTSPSQPENQSHLIKIQNEGNNPFHAFKTSEKGQSSCDQGVDTNSKKTSIFHNFQKHLITTLRTCITFRSGRNNDPSDRLVVSLWDYFMKSNKPTKKYLYSLLMSQPQIIADHNQDFKDKEAQEEFEKVVKEASEEEMKQAQLKLRFHLMVKSKRLLEDGELNHRRMRRLQQFKEYFATFIQDLQSGELNLRLPKKNKQSPIISKNTNLVPMMKKEGEQ